MTKREVMQMALDALEYVSPMYNDVDDVAKAIDAIEAELAKPEPEPVAWANETHDFSVKYSTFVVACDKSTGWDIPLYRKEDM